MQKCLYIILLYIISLLKSYLLIYIMQRIIYDSKRRGENKTKDTNTLINKILDSKVSQLLLVAISILMLLSVYRSIKQMGQKLSLLKQAEYEVEELRIKNLELSLQIEEASSIEHLEQEARDRPNYGLENEVVFVIKDELVEVGKDKVEEVLNPDSKSEDIEVWNEWVDFVIEGY